MKEYVRWSTEFYTTASYCDALGHTIIAFFYFTDVSVCHLYVRFYNFNFLEFLQLSYSLWNAFIWGRNELLLILTQVLLKS